jgi:hypothetical protein
MIYDMKLTLKNIPHTHFSIKLDFEKPKKSSLFIRS